MVQIIFGNILCQTGNTIFIPFLPKQMFNLEWLNVITSLRIYVSSMYDLQNATNTHSFLFLTEIYDIEIKSILQVSKINVSSLLMHSWAIYERNYEMKWIVLAKTYTRTFASLSKTPSIGDSIRISITI